MEQENKNKTAAQADTAPAQPEDTAAETAADQTETGAQDAQAPDDAAQAAAAKARVQELENLTIRELAPLRLGFLVSRRYEDKPLQDLLRELPWLQMRFQNRANFEAMLDAYMRPCGINPTVIYRPYSFMAKISAVERGQFLTVIPYFAWRLVNPAKLKYFDAPGSAMYMQEYLYSLKNHRYTATMLQHITEDRDGTEG